MNAAYAASMAATVERLEAEKDEITGVVITSAKKTFFAGGDLNDLQRARARRTRRRSPRSCARSRRQLRRLETLGKPVVAAINGAALGGGLEICAGRHHRVDRRRPARSSSASPRSSSACCPGAGGVVRTVRMLGIVDALMQLLLQGQRLRPAQGARRSASSTRSSPRARSSSRPRRRGSRRNPEAVAAVGRQGLQDPRRHAVEPEARAEPAGVPGQPAQAAQGRELPGAAPHHGRGGRGRAGRLRHRASRSRAATSSTSSPSQVAKNMIQAFFFDLQQVNGDRGRPADIEPLPGEEGRRARRRHDGRRDRLRVREGRHRGRAQGRLRRRPPSAARATREKLVDKAVARGRTTQEQGDALLGADHRRPPTRPTPRAPTS